MRLFDRGLRARDGARQGGDDRSHDHASKVATLPDPRARPLRESDLDPDPLSQFEAWFEEARAAGIELAEATALATASGDGRPSVRMVLMKGFDERGFVFYSGYESRKGHELTENPRAALCFYWHPLGRQVRIEGSVERVGEAESAAYFGSRPLGSRLSATVSHQSEVVGSREELEAAVDELRARHGDEAIPLPPDWGGFRLTGQVFEFWQHREDRLHDRFRYRRAEGGWLIERLAP
jgi:pyridoxamine 5'-phosphate oxidase